MTVRVRWRLDEFDLLIGLYRRQGRHPSDEGVDALQRLLRHRAKPFEARAGEPSFRSAVSIRRQLGQVEVIDRQGVETRQWVPAALREAWAFRELRERERRELEALIEEGPPVETDPRRVASFFDLVIGLLAYARLESTLLLAPANGERFRLAWAELSTGVEEARGDLDRLLADPEARPYLESYGLAGAQFTAKISGAWESVRSLFENLAWPGWRRILRWANVFLGTLATAFPLPVLDALKEVKEAFEAGGEEEFELAAERAG